MDKPLTTDKAKKYLIFIIKLAIVYCVTEAAGTGFRILTGIIDGQHGAPSFLTPSFTVYEIIAKIMLLIGFFMLVNYIPVKGRIAKGVLFFVLFWGSAYLPQMLGMMGGESSYIAKEALSIGTVFADTAGYLVRGLALGFCFAKKDKPEKKTCNRSKYIIACIASTLLFPAVLGLFELIGGEIFPILRCVKVFSIAEGQHVSFHVIFYLCQGLSGFMFAVFYRLTEYNRKGSWLYFASVLGWLLWLPIVLIMILFGTAVAPTLIWSAFMVGAIYLDIFVVTKIMKPTK